MRGVIRKAMNIDSIFWIIALSAFIVVIYVLFIPDVSAISRAELNELEAQEKAVEESLLDYDIQLTDQRILISDQEGVIKELREQISTVSNSSDWESLRLKLEYNDAVQEAVNYAKELRNGLGDIITLKSDAIKFLK